MKRKLSSKSKNMKKKRDYIILLSVIFYFVIIKFIYDKGEIYSGAYFLSALSLIFVFLIPFPYSLMEVVSRYIRTRVDNMMYRNAKRVVYFSIIISLIYSLLISSVILILNKWICEVILISSKCSLSLLLLLPLIVFSSISCVFRGFFRGAKLKKHLYYSMLIELLAMLLGIFLFSNIFESIGTRIVGVLYDENINNAFFSAGVSLGISFGSLIGMLFSCMFFSMSFKRLVIDDNTKRLEDVYDLGIKLFSEALVLGFSLFLFLSFFAVNQILLGINEKNNNLFIYDMGVFYNVISISVVIPLIFTFIYSYIDRRSLRIGYNSNDRLEIRAKIASSIKQFFTYSVPFIFFMIVMADLIVPIGLSQNSELAVSLFRVGIPTLIFLGMSIIFQNILISINRNTVAIFNNIISLIVVIIVFIYLKEKNIFGMFISVISLYIFSVINCVLSYIFVKKFMKYKPQILNNFIKPFFAGIFVLVISLILRLLLGLFAPDLISINVIAIVDFVVSFIIMFKLKTFSYQAVKRSSISFILMPLGKMFNLFKE